MWWEESVNDMTKGFLQRKIVFLPLFKTEAAVLFSALLLLLFSFTDARATWLLDPARFHASAHGQTACTDCHGQVSEQSHHPKPGNVGKHEKDFFKAGRCLDCHDQVMDNLEQGVHGNLRVKNKAEYSNCLRCHDPHTQPPLGKNLNNAFRPDRPVEDQCGACHKKMSALPPFSQEDAACMACHQTRNAENPQDIQAIQRLCFHCHGKGGDTAAREKTAKHIPLMDQESYAGTPHAHMACTTCHKDAADFGHDRQDSVNCRRCHPPHHEKVTHDAHVGISCQACHLGGIVPFRDSDASGLLWRRDGDVTDLSILHQMHLNKGEASCKRCHFAGNNLGAAAVALPAKSILCMPCHTATFSLDDTLSITAFVVFLFGMALFVSVLLTGAMSSIAGKNPLMKLLQALFNMLGVMLSPRVVPIVKALFWDAFLQRRLYSRSPARWFIHGLIFYPFVLRFFWGMAALVGSRWAPENPIIWDMINKNHPITAFLFDLTGIMILVGIVSAWTRGALQKRTRAAGTPPQDRIALGLIGATVLIGFLLEGMRIIMTGHPPSAGYSFVGNFVGQWFSPSRGLPEVYSIMWYIHAALTGAFIAYIPFSRLLHMILAPVVISINAVSAVRRTRNEHSGTEA